MQKIKEINTRIEDESVSDKHWSLVGEISSRQRPENSLLETSLDFEHTAKPKPVITEEVTLSLEGMIKKRILDNSYDDVIRKMEITESFRPQIEPESEKSKIGLGEIYEKEFVKQMSTTQEPSALDKKHTEIQDLFSKLCYKLDALSNFAATPKPIDTEIKIVPNVPSIAAEDAIPLTVSNQNLLRPEEVYTAANEHLKHSKRGQLVGETELTREDRGKMRRQKKQQKHEEKKGTITKADTKKDLEKKIAKNKNTIMAKNSGKGNGKTKTSEMFAKMQDNASTVESIPTKRMNTTKTTANTSSLKL